MRKGVFHEMFVHPSEWTCEKCPTIHLSAFLFCCKCCDNKQLWWEIFNPLSSCHNYDNDGGNYVNVWITYSDALLLKFTNVKCPDTFLFLTLTCSIQDKCSNCSRTQSLRLNGPIWKCFAAVRSLFLAIKEKPHHLRVLFYFLTAFLITVNWNQRAADVTGWRKAPLTDDLTFNLENWNLINTLKVILYLSCALKLYNVVDILDQEDWTLEGEDGKTKIPGPRVLYLH